MTSEYRVALLNLALPDFTCPVVDVAKQTPVDLSQVLQIELAGNGLLTQLGGLQKRQAGLGLVECSLILDTQKVAEYARAFVQVRVTVLPGVFHLTG
ncbi:hypothetical protein D3C73_953200 [compost metagenome]